MNNLIQKAHNLELKSAVGIVINERNEILLGLANADDDRDGKFVFPGGGIDKNEDVRSAAIREVYEETGIVCDVANNLVFNHPIKPSVGFVFLRAFSLDNNIVPNKEFHHVGWYRMSNLPEGVFRLNQDIINQLRSIDLREI